MSDEFVTLPFRVPLCGWRRNPITEALLRQEGVKATAYIAMVDGGSLIVWREPKGVHATISWKVDGVRQVFGLATVSAEQCWAIATGQGLGVAPTQPAARA
jgi:hypothetical protein